MNLWPQNFIVINSYKQTITSITFKVLYSSYPDHVGSANTAVYSITGDNVKMRHFKKLVDAQGKDITDQMPKDAWETSTRLK